MQRNTRWYAAFLKVSSTTSDYTPRRSKPSCFLLLAIRVVDETDLKQAIRMADSANQVMDGCGLFAYAPGAARYSAQVVPLHLEIDRVIGRICDALRQLS